MIIVAIKERSAGNESVGDMWLETKIFEPTTPASEIVKWGNGLSMSGKLILTTAQEDIPDADVPF